MLGRSHDADAAVGLRAGERPSGGGRRPGGGRDIRSLKVSGFKRNGIWASYTDRLSVQRVTAAKNGVWGIAQERSTRGLFSDNVARDNVESGLFIANTVDRE
ncbi:right-handed parallel beta-helix repeat-containing protein, partial [Streptomyces sp. 12297]